MNISNSSNALDTLKEGVTYNLNLNNLLINSMVAVAIIIAGIIIGKLVSKGLKMFFSKIDITKYTKSSFIDLIIVLIRWSIYILFLHLSLEQLGIPIVSQVFGNALITLPAFIAGIIILFLGFAISVYLRAVILELGIPKKELLAVISFCFVIYVMGIYAVKVALIPLGYVATNYIVIALSVSIPIAISLYLSRSRSD